MSVGRACDEGRGAFAAFSLLMALSLPGCETRSTEWTKAGATAADLRRDLADCEREGTGEPPWHFWALTMSYEAARDRIARVKNECMEARGWLPR